VIVEMRTTDKTGGGWTGIRLPASSAGRVSHAHLFPPPKNDNGFSTMSGGLGGAGFVLGSGCLWVCRFGVILFLVLLV
jgi:hypothetical protein